MNEYKKLWFWLLILSLLLSIATLATFEAFGETRTGYTTPVWVWVIFALTIVFWIIALILYIIDVLAAKKREEMHKQCSKKVIACVIPQKSNQNEILPSEKLKPLSELAPDLTMIYDQCI
jgi:hypothetical protein